MTASVTYGCSRTTRHHRLITRTPLTVGHGGPAGILPRCDPASSVLPGHGCDSRNSQLACQGSDDSEPSLAGQVECRRDPVTISGRRATHGASSHLAASKSTGQVTSPPSRRLPRPRDLLDHDGYRWTLLRHAIDVEHDGHVQAGGPLHGDVTTFLLTRAAPPVAASAASSLLRLPPDVTPGITIGRGRAGRASRPGRLGPD